jgi:hypothetical protein
MNRFCFSFSAARVTTGIEDFAKFVQACLSQSNTLPLNIYRTWSGRAELSMGLAEPLVAVLFGGASTSVGYSRQS